MVQHHSSVFLAAADVISVQKLSPNVQQFRRPQRCSAAGTAEYRLRIVWRNVLAFATLHSLAVYALFRLHRAKGATIVFMFVFGYLGAVGITAGAHRLWAHKCYKAKWQLRLLLMYCQTMAFQNHIYEWVRDHRVHHKFVDTDADPHNSKRGFFFSHIGWLMVRKHKQVVEKGSTVDMSDMEADAIVMWQKKYYVFLAPTATFVIPTLIPYLCWHESLSISFLAAVLRYVLSLNFTWLVNSAAHIWGMKPYDRFISARENYSVAAVTFGEGFHNYHHAFPWDYKAAELGDYSLNLSTALIDFFAAIGWAYDLKMATREIVEKRALRTGDGSRTDEETSTDVWGWDDDDMSVEDKKLVRIANKVEEN